jgi:hypothetical protein
MELKINFLNPTNGSTQSLTFKNVTGWKSDHGDVLIDQPGQRIMFSGRQCVWWTEVYDGPAKEVRQTDARDISMPTPYAVERAKASMVEFAIDGRVVPWSEAHMRKLAEYEDAVLKDYGQAAVDQLPWRRIPRGGYETGE